MKIQGVECKAVCAMRTTGERFTIYVPVEVADQADRMGALDFIYCDAPPVETVATP